MQNDRKKYQERLKTPEKKSNYKNTKQRNMKGKEYRDKLRRCLQYNLQKVIPLKVRRKILRDANAIDKERKR